MLISGNEPSSVILSQQSSLKSWKVISKNAKQAEAKRGGVLNPQNNNFNQGKTEKVCALKTLRIKTSFYTNIPLMISVLYKCLTWCHGSPRIMLSSVEGWAFKSMIYQRNYQIPDSKSQTSLSKVIVCILSEKGLSLYISLRLCL